MQIIKRLRIAIQKKGRIKSAKAILLAYRGC